MCLLTRIRNEIVEICVFETQSSVNTDMKQ